jgi:hypothetical protein
MNTVMTPTAPIQSTAFHLDPVHLTSWTPPAWADSVVTTGDLIESWRTLGVVPLVPVTGSDTLAVALVQRDEVRATARRIEVVRHPVAVLVGGVSLTAPVADGLARLIDRATELIAAPLN